jgi:NitT/TauT family transport system ATP-binding protein
MVTHNIEEAVLLGDRTIVVEKDPGHVIAEVQVPFPQPRRKKSSDFQSLVDAVYGLLAGETKAEHEELGTAPGEPGITRAIPNVTVNELAGFLEHLAGLRGEQRVDISGVADELHMDPIRRFAWRKRLSD